MPDAGDFLDAINRVDSDINAMDGDIKSLTNAVNKLNSDLGTKLDTVSNAINNLDNDIKTVEQLLLWGFQQLITLGQYTNLALFQNDQQNDTMICLLQQISKNTCGTWNEAHIQTGLQKSIKASARQLADLFALTHAEAELTREREEALRRQIEACCPPPEPPPICVEYPCPTPPPLEQGPPKTDPPPQIGPAPPPR